MDDPFHVLGFSSRTDVTVEAVKLAFRRIVHSIHSDSGGSGDGDAMVRLKRARQQALEALQNPEQENRSPFDNALFTAPPVRENASEKQGAVRWRDATTILRGADIESRMRVAPNILREGGRATAILRCDCPCCQPAIGSPVCRTCGGRSNISVASNYGVSTGPCPSCDGTGLTKPVSAKCHYDNGSAHLVVDVAAGTRDGDTIRVASRGMVGAQGCGDVVVTVDQTFAFRGRKDFALRLSAHEAKTGASIALSLPGVGDIQIKTGPGLRQGGVIYREIEGFLYAFRAAIDGNV